jgi:hypothetical protein
LNIAQSSGSSQIAIPASRARRRRNASVELASANSTKIPIVIQKRRGRGPAGARRPVSATGTSRGFSRIVRIRITTAAIPGTAASRNTERSFSKTNLSRNAATSGPTSAPALSIERCRPKALPRFSGATMSASSASRGDVRIPLPTRSANRIASTCPQLVARPIRGRANAAIE